MLADSPPSWLTLDANFRQPESRGLYFRRGVMVRNGWAGLLLMATLGWAPRIAAAPLKFGPNDVQSFMAIAKNSDANQVHYAIRLDEQCRATGTTPIFGYWRDADEKHTLRWLSWIDKFAYDVKIRERKPTGAIVFTIKGFQRPIEVVASRGGDGKCAAQALAVIKGAPAIVELVFAQVRSKFSVIWVELRGRALNGTEQVTERVYY